MLMKHIDVIKSDINLQPGIYDSEFIENCIQEKFLTHEDIESELTPSQTFPAVFFKRNNNLASSTKAMEHNLKMNNNNSIRLRKQQ